MIETVEGADATGRGGGGSGFNEDISFIAAVEDAPRACLDASEPALACAVNRDGARVDATLGAVGHISLQVGPSHNAGNGIVAVGSVEIRVDGAAVGAVEDAGDVLPGRKEIAACNASCIENEAMGVIRAATRRDRADVDVAGIGAAADRPARGAGDAADLVALGVCGDGLNGCEIKAQRTGVVGIRDGESGVTITGDTTQADECIGYASNGRGSRRMMSLKAQFAAIGAAADSRRLVSGDAADGYSLDGRCAGKVDGAFVGAIADRPGGLGYDPADNDGLRCGRVAINGNGSPVDHLADRAAILEDHGCEYIGLRGKCAGDRQILYRAGIAGE